MKMILCFLKKKFIHWNLEIEEILQESENIETPNEESFDDHDDS